jgi:hypothetical protein
MPRQKEDLLLHKVLSDLLPALDLVIQESETSPSPILLETALYAVQLYELAIVARAELEGFRVTRTDFGWIMEHPGQLGQK